MLTPEMLEARKKGIGGSDVAAILGLSKWQTAHGLYLEKRSEIPDEAQESTEIQHWGNVLEDVVAKEFERQNDLKVRKRHQHFTHKEHPFLMANIDRSVDGIKAVLECKTAGQFMASEWGESGSDQFPDYYRVQLIHYMNVLGYGQGYLGVLIGGNQYRQYYIEQDRELSEMIIQHCVEFWDRVENGNPPDIDYDHRTTGDMLKKLHSGTNGEVIHLPDQIQPWVDVLFQAKAAVKENEAVVDACKNRIAEAMGDASIGITPDGDKQFKRSLTKRKESIQAATEFMVMRDSNYKGGK